MKRFVLAVERHAMLTIADGSVRLEEVAAAFAGCPRLEALCENYLTIPGVRRPPPNAVAASLASLTKKHGALLVVGYNARYADEFWVLADYVACTAAAKTSPRDVFAHVIERLEARSKGLCLFSMKDWEKDMTECGGVRPLSNKTWITEELEPEVVTPRALLKTFERVTIDLIVDSKGVAIYSRNMLSDFTLAHGFERRYGPHTPEF